MAILGFQLVSTLVGASLLSKIVNYVSFARFLLCCNLSRFIYPTTDEIIKASNISRIDKKGKIKKPLPTEQNSSLNISKSINIELKRVPVVFRDLVQLEFYSDYQWLIDFSLCSSVVFFSNEFVYGWLLGATARLNLSVLWCFLGAAFALKALWNVTRLYFSMADSADLMIVLMSGFSFLLLAMVVLVVPERHLAFHIADGYRHFSQAIADRFPTSAGPVSLVAVKATLAAASALIGAAFTHSGLRYGKMYADSINEPHSPVIKSFLHFSFLFPVFILSLWLIPVQSFLASLRFGPVQLTTDDILSLRVYSIIVLCLSRLVLAPPHLQSYLNLAETRIRSLRKEAGKISILEYQKTIARIFHCFCLVALQYFAPIVFCFNVSLIYKSLGGLSWTGANRSIIDPPINAQSPSPSVFGENFLPSFFGTEINQSVEMWTVSLVNLRAVFTAVFYRGVIGYLVWFTVAAIQLTSLLGLVYHRNLNS